LIGRDLAKTIIIDNSPENFTLQNDNGICISSWYDDPTDNALQDLAVPLLEIAIKKPRDIREALSIFKMQMIENMENK
jgi:TFIIF-interacting CTD phosphatase-like protein